MDDARVTELAYPDEDRVETPNGTVCFRFVNADRVQAVSGLDVGWFDLDGVKYCAAVNLVPEDGAWTADARGSRVALVVQGRAAGDAPAPVRATVLALIEAVCRRWLADRPDLAARVRACDARAAIHRAEEEIAALSERLEALRARLPRLRRTLAEAEADLERIAGEAKEGGRVPRARASK